MEDTFAAKYDLTVYERVVQGWLVRYVQAAIGLSKPVLRQAASLIEQWRWAHRAFEHTWVLHNLQVPTLWLKFDCVVNADGRLGVYEIDDCPDGVGIGYLVNSAMRLQLKRVRQQWPHFVPLLAAGRTTDDELWLEGALSLETVNGQPGLILPRPNQLGDGRFSRFAYRSVGPCLTQGCKAYGEQLGLWQPVCSADELDWHQSFVLKPIRGYGGSDVCIRHKSSFRGASGKGSIISALQKHGTMYRQPFIMPMTCPFDAAYLMVLRPYFGFDVAARCYRYLGGCWLARPGNLKLHGAADAIVGPLI